MEHSVTVSVGMVSFSASGGAEWVRAQAEWFIEQLEFLAEAAPTQPAQLQADPPDAATTPPGGDFKTSLAQFLKDNNADKSQNKKFLATAAWLRLKGSSPFKTSDVTAALKDAHQNRLGNASDCLGKNIKSGFIEKDGNNTYYVTDLGLQQVNIQ